MDNRQWDIHVLMLICLVTFLIAAGPWYRFIMYTSALLLMFITRYGIVENFLILVQQIQIMMLRKKKSA